MTAASRFIQDTQATINWLVRQGIRIESQVVQQPLPEIQYRSLFPIDTSGPAWAKTVGFYSGEQYGRAKWINGNSDDIPLADVGRQLHQSQIYTGGVGYGWGLEEIECALEAGQDFRPDKAMAARRASEEFIDDLVFNGDPLKGFTGFLNNPAITAQAPIYGDWLNPLTAPTEDQILRDINSLLISTGTATNYTSYANTLLLPHEQAAHLMSARLGDSGQTIYQFLQQNNAYTAATGRPLMIRAVRGLETAGVAGDARMVAYNMDRNTMVLHMPMPYRFLPVYHEDVLNWVVPGLFRTGGLEIRRESEIRYSDGI